MIISFIQRAIIQSIPLLFGSTGEIITEKSTSIAVEDSQFNFLEIILIFVLSASLLGLILASLEMFLPGLVLFCALLIALIYWHFFNRRLKNGMKLSGGFNYYHILIMQLLLLLKLSLLYLPTL